MEPIIFTSDYPTLVADFDKIETTRKWKNQTASERLYTLGPVIPIWLVDPNDTASRIGGDALIDTGASHSAILEKAASELKLPKAGTRNINSSSASTPTCQAQIIVHSHIHNVSNNLEMSILPSLDRRTAIIGRDLLSQWLFRYDGVNGQIDVGINETKAEAQTHSKSYDYRNNQPQLRVTISNPETDDRKEYWGLLDTGRMYSTIPDRVVKELDLSTTEDPVPFLTFEGPQKVDQASCKITGSNLHFPDNTDLRIDPAQSVDLLIGRDILKGWSVFFNGPKGSFNIT